MTNQPGKRGAAILPAVITAAVAMTLIQVPLLYRSKSGTKFTETQKSSVSAQSLAEAGIEEAITDIGRKALRINASSDTTPYANIGLGLGSYTTRVQADPKAPGILEMISTGRIGNASQSIRAKLALIKTPSTIPYDTPGRSAWGIRGEPPALYYQSLDERAAGQPWIHPEGEILLQSEGPYRIEDLAMAPDGTLYFIVNSPGTSSTLYKIKPSDLDGNPSSPVTPRLVGATGLPSGGDDEIRGLAFLAGGAGGRRGALYAATWNSRKIYALGLGDGAAKLVANLVPKGLPAGAAFHCDALAQAADGSVYLARNDAKSELWRFGSIPEASGKRLDTLSVAAEIPTGGSAIRALAGHPDGNLYATDDAGWYRLRPDDPDPAKRAARIFSDPSNLGGIAFHYGREDSKFTGRPLPAFDAADTAIQLKIMSWEEIPGDLASIR